MITEKEKLDEIKNYLGMLLDLWEGGNPSNKEIRKAFKTNTMSGYRELVEDLRKDGNKKEAERLLNLINLLENE
jgi:hypothetical protein